jgi:hypothetical protein
MFNVAMVWVRDASYDVSGSRGCLFDRKDYVCMKVRLFDTSEAVQDVYLQCDAAPGGRSESCDKFRGRLSGRA